MIHVDLKGQFNTMDEVIGDETTCLTDGSPRMPLNARRRMPVKDTEFGVTLTILSATKKSPSTTHRLKSVAFSG